MNNHNVRRKDRRYKVSSKYSSNLGKIFDKHVKCEFEDHDVEATTKTMVKEPYVHHVPTMTCGTGYDNV
jgi:carboxymethylenebutenolidase